MEVARPLGPPELLRPGHDLDGFDSGEPILDGWLRRRAARAMTAGTARTYAVESGGRVVGYCCLCAAQVELATAPGRARRNMPDPIPAVLIGRLAVDRSCQGKGLGRALLNDAATRTAAAAMHIGIATFVVRAISPTAKAFYEAFGFVAGPMDPLLLFLLLKDAAACRLPEKR